VDKGQQEAAFSVGMGSIQALKRIIFPQAFAIALPNLGNTVIQLFKETSLAFIIGVNDIMGEAQLIIARGYGVKQFETFIAVSLIYWGICIAMEKSFYSLEKMYKKGHKEIGGLPRRNRPLIPQQATGYAIAVASSKDSKDNH
jgi:L-cystine transport system permease protein